MEFNILGAFVVPLIFLFNSYFIGRFCKRIYPQYSSLLLTSLGFFIFLSTIFIFSVPIYVLPVSLLDYLILLALLQGILLVVYCINWRYTFSFEKICPPAAIFLAILIVIIFITWFFSNNLSFEYLQSSATINNEENLILSNWHTLIAYLSKPMDWTKLMFEDESKSLQYVSWNALNLAWIYLFQIPSNLIFSPYNSYLTNYAMVLLYSVITALSVTGIFYDKINNRDYLHIISLGLLILCINGPLFWITHSPLNGIAWIVPLSLLLLKLTFDSMVWTYTYKFDVLLMFLLISTYAMSNAFIFFNFAIVLVKMLLSALNKQPHIITSFLICSLGLLFPSIFLIQIVSLLAAFIFIVIMFVVYSSWFISIRYPRFKERVRQFEGWLQDHIVWFILSLVLLIYGASIILMFSGGSFTFDIKSWIILPNPFGNNFLVENMQRPQIEKWLQILLNVSFWVLNCAMFLYCCGSVLWNNCSFSPQLRNYFLSKHNKFKMRLGNLRHASRHHVHEGTCDEVVPSNIIYSKKLNEVDNVEKRYFAVFSLLVFLILWNPLSTNLINRAISVFDFDLSWLFFLSIIPSAFTYLSFKNQKNEAIFLSVFAVFAIGINTLLLVANFL